MESRRGPLFRALNRLISGSHTYQPSYKRARTKFLYPWVDLHEDDSLRNIYSGVRLDPVEVLAAELERFDQARPGFLAAFGVDDLEDDDTWRTDEEALEDLLESSMPFNCEHVVPQSWFDKRQPMKADLHHLFTCEPGCNSFRSNHPYFDFDPALDEDPDLADEIVRSDCGQMIDKRFEPDRGHGTVARATLYFLLRYPGDIGDAQRELQRERLEMLLTWHEVSPPRRYEKHRNAAIHAIQGNRNPLIDFPDLARKIDFDRGFG